MKVFYQRTYSIGPYLTERIGFEIEIDTPDPVAEVEFLKTMCDEAHKRMNPGLEVTTDYSTIPGHPMSEEKTDLSPEDALIETIGYCTTEKFLMGFKKQVDNSGSERVRAAFEKKLKSLQ